jgi:RimJ/RimL family protein N-acetyltransferase
MQPLKLDQFDRVLPLVENSPMKGCRAGWYSVLEARQKGAVFVDDCARPQTALICGHWLGTYYLFGEADNGAFVRFLPELVARHLTPGDCVFFATTDAWRQMLDPLFARKYTRLAYDFRPPAGWPPLDIPPDFVLQPFDVASAEWLQANMGVPWPWFVNRWSSIENFLEHGFGFCLVRDDEDKVASCSMTVAIGGGEAEIQVWTGQAFRGCGLATLTATAFIKDCQDRGLKPGWTTDLGNQPSIAVARKVGFVCLGEIYGYLLASSYQCRDGQWGPISN